VRLDDLLAGEANPISADECLFSTTGLLSGLNMIESVYDVLIFRGGDDGFGDSMSSDGSESNPLLSA
jgi:hypothetical protein